MITCIKLSSSIFLTKQEFSEPKKTNSTSLFEITDKDSFSNYMRRGLGEAKEGKRRKAGEIFEFLPPSARVVSGTARLGDIVM